MVSPRKVLGSKRRSDKVIDDPDLQSEMLRIDGLIPEKVDRRAFFKSAVALATGSALAGCTGDGGDGGTGGSTGGSSGGSTGGSSGGSTGGSSGGDGGTETANGGTQTSDVISRDTVFWNSWEPEMDWCVGYVAQGEGFWEEAGATFSDVVPGQGSGDGGRRVGTGVQDMCVASITPQVSGWAQGYNMYMFGAGRLKANQGMLWRTDRMDGPTDLEGKSLATTSALNEEMFYNVWLTQVATDVDPDSVDMTSTDTSTAFVLLAEGEIDGIFQTVDAISALRSVMEDRGVDATVEAELLYNHVPLMAYVLLVNSDFYGQTVDDTSNEEFTTRILQGYSHATKWVMFNPEDAVTFMQQEINDALQAQETEDLVNEVNASIVSQNLGELVQDVGVCGITEDIVETNIQTLSDILEDVDEAPALDDVLTMAPQEGADLAQISSTEHQELVEQAAPYSDLYL
ncbi:MAG: ABC transporter substrate-binding protein [Halobacteriota archaeon]